MSRLGADPDDLRDLAARLRGGAHTVDVATVELERRLRAAAWHGTDADRFEAEWRHVHRPALRRVGDGLRDGAQRLEAQVREQEAASVDNGTAAVGPVVAGSAAARRAHEAGGRSVPAPAPPALDELQLRAGTEVTAAGLVLGMRQDVSIRRLAGGGASITTTETQRGGVVAVVGASGGIRTAEAPGGTGHLLGAGGDVGVAVAQITRQQYLVEDADVGSTLVRLGAEQALGAAGDALRQVPVLGVAAAVEPAVAAWGWLADRVTGSDDTHGPFGGVDVAPDPDRVERMTEVAVTSSIGASFASAMGLEADAELSGAIRLGEARAGDVQLSRIVEVDGTLAAALQGTVLDRLGLDAPGLRPMEATLRIEVPLHPVDGVDAIVTATTSDGSVVHQSTSNVALAGRATSVALDVGSAVRQLREGDVTGAVSTIVQLDLSPDAVATTTARLQIDDHALGGGALVGEVVGVGVDGEGGVRRLTPTG